MTTPTKSLNEKPTTTTTPSKRATPGGLTTGTSVHDAPNVALGEEKTTWGRVSAFTIDAERLLIKLNVSAISRMLVSVGVDEPHFKSAASLAMIAYNNGESLSVRYFDAALDRAGTPETMVGREFGLGEDAFEIEDWPFEYHP